MAAAPGHRHLAGLPLAARADRERIGRMAAALPALAARRHRALLRSRDDAVLDADRRVRDRVRVLAVDLVRLARRRGGRHARGRVVQLLRRARRAGAAGVQVFPVDHRERRVRGPVPVRRAAARARFRDARADVRGPVHPDRHAAAAPAVQHGDDARRGEHGHLHQHPERVRSRFLRVPEQQSRGRRRAAVRVRVDARDAAVRRGTRGAAPAALGLGGRRALRVDAAARRPAQPRVADARSRHATAAAPRRVRRPPPSVDRKLPRPAHRAERARPAPLATPAVGRRARCDRSRAGRRHRSLHALRGRERAPARAARAAGDDRRRAAARGRPHPAGRRADRRHGRTRGARHAPPAARHAACARRPAPVAVSGRVRASAAAAGRSARMSRLSTLSFRPRP
ncbi:hypothetical protein F01_520055 [Burkholderia cenocepacia]|nr:hypothetical protein F01_520055 [Burkholderia cenocepacia]